MNYSCLLAAFGDSLRTEHSRLNSGNSHSERSERANLSPASIQSLSPTTLVSVCPATCTATWWRTPSSPSPPSPTAQPRRATPPPCRPARRPTGRTTETGRSRRRRRRRRTPLNASTSAALQHPLLTNHAFADRLTFRATFVRCIHYSLNQLSNHRLKARDRIRGCIQDISSFETEGKSCSQLFH